MQVISFVTWTASEISTSEPCCCDQPLKDPLLKTCLSSLTAYTMPSFDLTVFLSGVSKGIPVFPILELYFLAHGFFAPSSWHAFDHYLRSHCISQSIPLHFKDFCDFPGSVWKTYGNLISKFIGSHLPGPFAIKCAMFTNASNEDMQEVGLYLHITEIMCL